VAGHEGFSINDLRLRRIDQSTTIGAVNFIHFQGSRDRDRLFDLQRLPLPAKGKQHAGNRQKNQPFKKIDYPRLTEIMKTTPRKISTAETM
jgi:hypothetical protein